MSPPIDASAVGDGIGNTPRLVSTSPLPHLTHMTKAFVTSVGNSTESRGLWAVACTPMIGPAVLQDAAQSACESAPHAARAAAAPQ
jgi:hypothetical protein